MKIRTLVIEIGIKNIDSLKKYLNLKNIEFIFASSFLDVVDIIYLSDIHIILVSDFRGIKSTIGYIKMFIKTNSDFKIIILSNQKNINEESKYNYVQCGASSFISCFDLETIKNQIYDIYTEILNHKENFKNWSICTKKAIRFLKDNYYIKNGIMEKLIKTVKYSESTIYHSIKKDTGITIGKWLNNLRINGAIKLLKSTLMPVKIISEKTGYNSVQGFIKAFKKITGKTPNRLRNS